MSRGVAVRLFLTCWLVYGLHFATNIVREHYPAFSLAERGTLRVDPYLGLHPDLFALDGRGAFINNNPGASMIAAIPYALARPAVDAVVERVAARRAASGEPLTADYETRYPNRIEFFRKVRERGLDVRFGLAAWVTHALCMAPLGAAAAVVMRALLLRLGFGAGPALWLALLYAFGTPVFFRTGYLSQNMLVTHFTLLAFALLYRPEREGGIEGRPAPLALAGASLGAAILCDYSGAIPALALGTWALAKQASRRGAAAGLARTLWMAAGAALPLAILLGYQQWAFGNPFLPAQRYMPATEYSARGWFGMRAPALDLLVQNLFDLRFGLFAAAPVLLLGLWGAVDAARGRGRLRGAEAALALGLLGGLLLFSSANQFGRLQWNTGVRYMVPAVPLLFLGVASVLERLPRPLALAIAVLALAQSWALAMVREDVVESLTRVLLAGFQLPWLNVLGQMGGQYVPYFEKSPPSPLPLMLLAGALVACLWWPARREAT